jgi:hypothetical protein
MNPSRLVINVDLGMGRNYVAPNLGLLHYYCMEHVDSQGVPYHEHWVTMFKCMHMGYAPQLGQAMKDWIRDNVRFGLSTA